jgi:hypothetical protein
VQEGPTAPVQAARDGSGGGSSEDGKGVTVLDADTMDEDSLQEAVGLLAQLEARAGLFRFC